MNRKRPVCLSLLFVVFATGCSDTPKSIFRAALNTKNELIDALMKVVDEPSAAKFQEKTVKPVVTRLKQSRDKLNIWAIDQGWSWTTWNPEETSMDEVLATVKGSRAAVREALIATKDYLAEEKKNEGRILHEVQRLQNRLAQLTREKEGSYISLSLLADAKFFMQMRIDK